MSRKREKEAASQQHARGAACPPAKHPCTQKQSIQTWSSSSSSIQQTSIGLKAWVPRKMLDLPGHPVVPVAAVARSAVEGLRPEGGPPR